MSSVLLLFHVIGMAHLVLSTIDINLPEMEYIADHLSTEECRRLVASLHDPGFDMTGNLDLAERKVPEEVPCLNMLLHWNSARGEGKGKTHSVLSHRLDQLKRKDLADWLSKTVFHQLAQDLNRTLLNEPLEELAEPRNMSEAYRGNRNPIGMEIEKIDTQSDWTPLDTICFTLILVLASITLFLLVRVSWRHAFVCHHFKKPSETDPKLPKSRNYKVKYKKKKNKKKFTEESKILLADTSDDDTSTSPTGLKKQVKEQSSFH